MQSYPLAYPLAGKRVWVAGHTGLVGAAVSRRLLAHGCAVLGESRARLDLRRQADVERYVARVRPHTVVVAAGTVGGVLANRDRPADFLSDNVMIAANVIGASQAAGVEKLLYLGSSCIYPRDCPQPMREEMLLTGAFEPTNAAYATAKIAGLALAQSLRRQHGFDAITALPTNLYGPGDRYDASAHAPAALIARMHAAKLAGVPQVQVWGSGRALREFLHVDDVARALIVLLQRWSSDAPVNVGSGAEVSVAELARTTARVVGYRGRLRFDPTMPEGAPRKRLEGSRMASLGWAPAIGLEAGLADAYADYLRRYGPEIAQRAA